MKKLSQRRRDYALVLTRSRFARRKSEIDKRRARRRSLHMGNAVCFHLIAPRVFSASHSRDRQDLLQFLKLLRRRLVTHRKPLRIDFRKTEQMVSCGTLLFIAELDRCLRATRNKVHISYISPKDKIVSQVIQQVGISALLGRKQRLSGDFDKTVRHWHFASGVHADAKEFDKVLDSYEGIMAPALSNSIFKGVTEAMTNCAQHAYLESRGDGLSIHDERRWWMLSQEMDGILSVAFCDLGMGIPRSLPRQDGALPGWRGKLSGFLTSLSNKPKESSLIKAAIEIGQSRTKEEHRGLGLKQIVETVQKHPLSHVLILSNSGGYLLQPDRRREELLLKYDDSILGTLIQWNMPIAAGEIHDGTYSEN